MARKVKITRLHGVLSLLIALVVTIVVGVTVFKRSGILSYQLSKHINDHYLAGTDFRFSCGRISGDMVREVSLSRPVLQYIGDRGPVEVFRADRVTLDYNLLEILKLKMIANSLIIDNPRVAIITDDSGAPILPVPSPAAKSATTGMAPHIEIETISIRRLAMVYEGKERRYRVQDVSLVGALRAKGRETWIRIDEGTGRMTEPDMPITEVRADLTIEDNALRVDDFLLRLDKSLLMVTGTYRDGHFEGVQGIANPLDLAELSALGFLPETAGELGGNITANGTRDSLSVRGSVTGQAAGLVLSGVAFEGVVTPVRAEVTNVEGSVFGNRINGAARYTFGEGSYSFQGVCEGLDLSTGLIPAEDIPKTDFNGLVHLDYDATQKIYDVRADLRRSVVLGFECAELQGRIQWREDEGLRIRSLTATRPGFELTAAGTVDLQTVADLIVHLEGDSLDYLLDYLSLPYMEGDVDLSGRLVGPLDGLQLNLNGTCRDLVYAITATDSAEVHAEVRNIGGEPVEVTLDLAGAGLQLAGKDFENPHILLEARPDLIVVRDFSFARGDSFVTSSFNVVPGDTALVELSHLVLTTPYAEWKNINTASIELHGESARMDTLHMTSNGHDIAFYGYYSVENDRCDIHTWGENIDLSVLRAAIKPRFWVEGHGEFAGRISGLVDNPWVDLDVHLANGVIDSVEFDTLDFIGAFDRDGYRVDELVIIENTDTLSAAGHWGYMDSPIRIVRSGLDTDSAFKAPIAFRVTSSGYPLPAVMKEARQKSFWGGAFTGTVVWEQTLESPRLTILGRMTSRKQDRYQIPPIALNVAYGGEVLSVRSLDINDGKTIANVTGSIPMRLGIRGIETLVDRPVDFAATIESKDLSTVARYFGRIATATGKVSGRVKVSGPAGKPHYVGALAFDDCVFRLVGTQETYRKVKANMVVENDIVRLTSFSAEEGKKGKVTGAGTARLEGIRLKSYDVTLDFKDLSFSSIPGFVSRQNGRLHIVSKSSGSNERTIPSIEGRLEIKEAVYDRPLGGGVGPPPALILPTETPGWVCDLEISAPKNVWVRNLELRMEVGGDVRLRRDERGLYLRGEMSVLRGSYTLYNNRFRITDGRFDFTTVSALRPVINLSAYTPHRVSGDQERRIYLHFDWPADKKEPTLRLSYDDPSYSEADLWRMLGGQVVVGDASIGQEGGWDAGTTAQNIASTYLERALNTQMNDMVIEVDSRTLTSTGARGTTERELSIAVGKYIGEDLYVKYRQGLSLRRPQTAFDLEYRLSQMWLFRSEVVRYFNRGLPGENLVTDEVNFDIKFRFEY